MCERVRGRDREREGRERERERERENMTTAVEVLQSYCIYMYYYCPGLLVVHERGSVRKREGESEGERERERRGGTVKVERGWMGEGKI